MSPVVFRTMIFLVSKWIQNKLIVLAVVIILTEKIRLNTRKNPKKHEIVKV